MELSVETVLKNSDPRLHYYLYTVHVENRRILTVVTSCSLTLSKWLKLVLKTSNSPLRRRNLIVGVSVDRAPAKHLPPYSSEVNDLLQICTGSHCLLYLLPNPRVHCTPRCLLDFFSSPKVTAVGTEVAAVKDLMEVNYGVKFGEVVESETKMAKEAEELLEFVKAGRETAAFFGGERWRWWSLDAELDEERVMYDAVEALVGFRVGWGQVVDGHVPGKERKRKQKKWKSRRKGKKVSAKARKNKERAERYMWDSLIVPREHDDDLDDVGYY